VQSSPDPCTGERQQERKEEKRRERQSDEMRPEEMRRAVKILRSIEADDQKNIITPS
jgi:hypothetical protein